MRCASTLKISLSSPSTSSHPKGAAQEEEGEGEEEEERGAERPTHPFTLREADNSPGVIFFGCRDWTREGRKEGAQMTIPV